MSGRFVKAPLVYVTAQVCTTNLPSLDSDQLARFEQAMIKTGLPELKSSKAQEPDLRNLADISDAVSQIDPGKLFIPIIRRAFMSAERTECLIIERQSIEYRTSEYTKYADFMTRFQQILETVAASTDAYSAVISRELILSYADVIVPYPDRTLSDYFNNDGRILPLNVLDSSAQDLQRFGQVQISRITKPDERIVIFLEQVPLNEGRILRYLPQALIEQESEFGMPLTPNLPEKLTSKDYGLLMSQAAKIQKLELGRLNVSDAFESLHILTSQTFTGLLNREICNIDWQYED